MLLSGRKEFIPEILHFCLQVNTPSNFTLQHLFLWINIEKSGTLCEKEHPPPAPQTLLLVQDTLLQNEVALNKLVVLIVLLLSLHVFLQHGPILLSVYLWKYTFTAVK